MFTFACTLISFENMQVNYTQYKYLYFPQILQKCAHSHSLGMDTMYLTRNYLWPSLALFILKKTKTFASFSLLVNASKLSSAFHGLLRIDFLKEVFIFYLC